LAISVGEIEPFLLHLARTFLHIAKSRPSGKLNINDQLMISLADDRRWLSSREVKTATFPKRFRSGKGEKRGSTCNWPDKSKRRTFTNGARISSFAAKRIRAQSS
jgi:hypothetical protein